MLGLLCSVRCPGDLILKTYDLARELRDEGVAVIGGFHTPMEKECLRLLLRGRQTVVICPGRSLEEMRVPGVWRKPLVDGRLLVVSAFERGHKRVTASLADLRNELVAALATDVFMAHAEEGGRTLALARKALSWGKRVWTFDSPENAALLAIGAQAGLPSWCRAACVKR